MIKSNARNDSNIKCKTLKKKKKKYEKNDTMIKK